MSESRFIERKRRDVMSADSFESLKQEGLRLVQELSGSLWTDYNLHDPGVTILDQLCYALTDLISRTEWETADYLTGADGTIDFDLQALYRPHQIFPSQPITINDYRKMFFDAIPEIDNVWIQTDRDGQTPGLYGVVVKLLDVADERERDAASELVREKIREIYADQRNLCEDLQQDVPIVEPRFFTLHGSVEVESSSEPADILADIYFQCAKRIGPGIVLTPFEEMLRQEKSLEDILTGPLTQHGYIDEEALNQVRQAVTIADLISLIAAIEGVREIHSLWLEDHTGGRVEAITYDASFQFFPYLQFPPDDEAIGVRLYKNEREYRATLRRVRRRFDRLNAEYQRLRQTGQSFARVYAPPQGEFRQLRHYFSMQHHFPEMYGINQYGVPDSESSRRKAQAKQLKAYLVFFEQIMANFLANVDAIPRLFSLDQHLRQSYFHQLLDNHHVPHIEPLYQGAMDQVEAHIAQIVGHYDPFVDRRNRILDYLLGMYGEKFTQNSLRNFNYYYTDDELGHELIRNKIQFLTHLVEISQKRAGALNYREVSWNTDNVSGLQKKVGILLGLHYFQTRSLTDVFTARGLELISDEQYRDVQESTVELEFVDQEDIEERMRQQFHEIPREKPTETDARRLVNEIIFLKNNVVSESILRNGIYPDSYRVGSRGDDNTFQIIFRPDERSRWYYLASYSTEQEAIEVAKQVPHFLLALNVESEGLHLIEHILLRPLSRDAHEITVPDDFYACTISVILPSWTARFSDNAFRQLAEETVRLNCPAHIYPTFYWLDFEEIRVFEELYMTWLDLKRSRDANGVPLDTAAEQLIAFLLRHRGDAAG